MIKTAKKKAKETGRTIDDILMEIIYEPDKSIINARLAAIKIYKEYTITKSSEKSITVNDNRGPVILPEMLPDPGKVVQLKKANA